MIVYVILTTIFFGTLYITQQQQLRMGANDPQIQHASDTAAQLNAGTPPNVLVTGKVNMATSLASFTTIYDKNGRIIVSNASLNNKIPALPDGVLGAANNKEYSAISWQPQQGVRSATIVVAAKDYYVVSGRSLKEVEKRESHLLYYVLFGYVLSLLIMLTIYIMKPRGR